jgi:hypothetical protein
VLVRWAPILDRFNVVHPPRNEFSGSLRGNGVSIHDCEDD